jgi:membrane protein DedA with SNARE-associated domain
MVTAGAVAMPWRRFLTCVAAAGAIWACYGGLIGYLGGSAFEEETWKGLVLALALALVLGLVVESGRRLIQRRRAVGA